MALADLKRLGTTFVWRGLLVFVIVQCLVLPGPPPSQFAINGRISDARNRLGLERALLVGRVKTIEGQIDVLISRSAEGPTLPDRRPTIADVIAGKSGVKPEFQKQLDALVLQRDPLVDRLNKIDVDDVNLAKSRIRSEFKIPGTDAAIDDSEIRPYYPLALAVFLAVILCFRRATLSAIRKDGHTSDRPLWLAPFSPPDHMNFLTFVGLNAAGLLLQASLLYLFWRFVHRDEVFSETLVLQLNIASGLLCVVLMAEAIVGVFLDLRRRT